MVTKAAPKSLAQKAMFDEGKASFYFADAMGLKWLFFDTPLPFFCVLDCSLVAAVGMC